MKTNLRRTGVTLAAPLLALLLQSCGGGGVDDEITEVTMEPETVPAPTAQTPSAFAMKVRVKNNHPGRYLRLHVHALRTGTESEYDRIGIVEAYGDETVIIECNSTLPDHHPELRQIGCFGNEHVVRDPGPMTLRLTLYNHTNIEVSAVQDRSSVTAELQ